MNTSYRPTAAPAGSAFVAQNCSECGHEELKNVVWLTDGNGPVPFGSGCAAVKLGWATTRENAPTKAAFDRRYYQALKDRASELLKAEREARQAGNLELSEALTAEVRAIWAAQTN